MVRKLLATLARKTLLCTMKGRHVCVLLRNLKKLRLCSTKCRKATFFILGLLSIGLLVHMLINRHYEKVYVKPASCTAANCELQTPIPYSKMRKNLMLILIHSSAKNEKVRDIIRETWVSTLDHSVVQYRFVIGSSLIPDEIGKRLRNENSRRGDLILLPEVTDSKATLSQRTLDSFSKVLQEMEFSYVLKCDDDSIADVPRIATELEQRPVANRLYWGYFSGSKFLMKVGPYAENNWHICDRYTPIAAGGGYILSRDLIQLIVQSMYLLHWYVAEDVTISAALSPYNIERVHDSRFNTPGWPTRGCKEPYLITHKIDTKDITMLYNSLKMENRLCSKTTRWHFYMGYLYNWTVLPKDCCLINHSLP